MDMSQGPERMSASLGLGSEEWEDAGAKPFKFSNGALQPLQLPPVSFSILFPAALSLFKSYLIFFPFYEDISTLKAPVFVKRHGADKAKALCGREDGAKRVQAGHSEISGQDMKDAENEQDWR